MYNKIKHNKLKFVFAIFGIVVLLTIAFFIFNQEKSNELTAMKYVDSESYLIINTKKNHKLTIQGSSNDILQVFDSNENIVETITRIEDNLVILEPVSFYTEGETYHISLPEGATFFEPELSQARTLYFSIERPEIEIVKYKSNVEDYSKTSIEYLNGNRIKIGNIKALEVGDIIIVKNRKYKNIQDAIKIEKIINTDNTYELIYSIPKVDEVYEELNIYKEYVPKKDDFYVNEEEFIELVKNDSFFSDFFTSVYGAEYPLEIKVKLKTSNGGIKATISAFIDDSDSNSKNLTANILSGLGIQITANYDNIKFTVDSRGLNYIGTLLTFDSSLSYEIITKNKADVALDLVKLKEGMDDLKKSGSASLSKLINLAVMPIPIAGPLHAEIDIGMKVEVKGALKIDFLNSYHTKTARGCLFINFEPNCYTSLDSQQETKPMTFLGEFKTEAGPFVEAALKFTSASKVGLRFSYLKYLDIQGGILTEKDFFDFSKWTGFYDIEFGNKQTLEAFAKADLLFLKVETEHEFHNKKEPEIKMSNSAVFKNWDYDIHQSIENNVLPLKEISITYGNIFNNVEKQEKLPKDDYKIFINDIELVKKENGFDVSNLESDKTYLAKFTWNKNDQLISYTQEIIFDTDTLSNINLWKGYQGNEEIEYFANNTIFDLGLLPVLFDNQAWGYIDQNGETKIKSKFSLAYPFDLETKLALVNLNGLYGYIDTDGEYVIDPIYEDATGFSHGFATVKLNGLWGYIKPSGEYLFEPQFSAAVRFQGGLGKVTQDGLIGYVNKSGVFAVKPKFKWASSFTEYSNLAWYEGENGLYGFINKQGNVAIQAKYTGGNFFRNGVAVVGVFDKEIQEVRYGYINENGNYIVKPKYLSASPFFGELARVQTFVDGAGAVFSFIDKSGKEVIKDLYSGWVAPTDFYEGKFAFAVFPETGKTKWACYDRDNKKVFSTDIEVISNYSMDNLFAEESLGIFSNGLVWYKINNLVGYMDKEGKMITTSRFNSLSDNEFLVAGFSKEGFTLVREGKRFSILTKSGNILNNQTYVGIQIIDKEE